MFHKHRTSDQRTVVRTNAALAVCLDNVNGLMHSDGHTRCQHCGRPHTFNTLMALSIINIVCACMRVCMCGRAVAGMEASSRQAYANTRAQLAGCLTGCLKRLIYRRLWLSQQLCGCVGVLVVCVVCCVGVCVCTCLSRLVQACASSHAFEYLRCQATIACGVVCHECLPYCDTRGRGVHAASFHSNL